MTQATVQYFDFSVNLMQAILWQYENAPKMVALAQAQQRYASSMSDEFWDAWRRDVFDLHTANDFGLSVWARILDYPITISDAPRFTGAVWGFGANHFNFENGNFGIGSEREVAMTTEDARKLLKLRWFKLTMRPTVPNINAALNLVFGVGVATVSDGLDMTLEYFFSVPPSNTLRDMLNRTDALPRPAGVQVTWTVQVPPSWGFGVNHLNFENGNFGTKRIIS